MARKEELVSLSKAHRLMILAGMDISYDAAKKWLDEKKLTEKIGPEEDQTGRKKGARPTICVNKDHLEYELAKLSAPRPRTRPWPWENKRKRRSKAKYKINGSEALRRLENKGIPIPRTRLRDCDLSP